MMNFYQYDWQNILTGTIELVAENGTLVKEKFMNITLKELLDKTQYL